jgi:predicted nicotinamide N-methyase
MTAGAAAASGVDIDPRATAAIELNARANRVRVGAIRRDVLDDPPPDVEVILAGDFCYELALAERVMPWLERAQGAGIEVLVGDPGRRYLPASGLVEIACYDVRTTTELEDLDHKQGRVYRLRS